MLKEVGRVCFGGVVRKKVWPNVLCEEVQYVRLVAASSRNLQAGLS
jgi:hypothetical protein